MIYTRQKYPLCLPTTVTNTLPMGPFPVKEEENTDYYFNLKYKKEEKNSNDNPYSKDFWEEIERRAQLNEISDPPTPSSTNKEEEKPKEKPKLEIDPKAIGSDIVVIDNTSEISEEKKKVYDAIIAAFEEHPMGKANLFMILQSIPYIEKVEDVVVVYLKMPTIFEKINIPCVNLALSIKKKLGDDIKLRFIPFASRTIAEYYGKVKYNL